MKDTLVKPTYRKAGPDDFFKKLQKEVQENVLNNPKIQRRNVIKSIGVLLSYFVLYACVLLFGNNTFLLFFFYILLGFNTIILFINAFHDAAHGAVFKTKKYNKWFMYVLELFGSNNYIWSKRHVLLHHPYPNVQNWDTDIKQSDLVHLFPDSPLLKIHKYQHIYMWLLYPLYTLNWLFIRDFKDFFGTKDNYLKRILKIPRIEYVKMFAAKIFNLFYLIGIPILVLSQPWHLILLAWLVMHISASLLGVVALISTHVDEDAVFPMPPEDGKMNSTWAEHQLMVTKDFSADSPLANFLFGGFTHHVAHHLFPHVAHTYYPRITPIIRRYAEEYNLPYKCYPAYQAMLSHYYLLKKSGVKESIFAHGEI
ncbi:fatty acid desaturase family protein [Albibacterium profundi]|uniref:Fatty acid desaturase n=1 Tax=Albibacterium profundi TaxID=3134906 RepID=A0ABV5CH68_9SPHI